MVGVINYGLGNIQAFLNIYKNANIKHKLINTMSDLDDVTHLILPGVGAFDYAMYKFNASGLREKVEELVFQKNIPIIGICVGMQMLMESSEEGIEKGLGWIEGEVLKFNFSDDNILIPHMGLNTICHKENNLLLKEIENEAELYFLHSYYVKPKLEQNTIVTTDYGIEFASVIVKDNIYGIQPHPEKSHDNGIKILTNFAKL